MYIAFSSQLKLTANVYYFVEDHLVCVSVKIEVASYIHSQMYNNVVVNICQSKCEKLA